MAIGTPFTDSDFQLGNQFKKSGDWVMAIAAYQRAINNNPEFFWAYVHLAEVLEKQGDLEDAVNCHRQAIAINSNSYWSYYNLSKILVQQGNLSDAIEVYRKAVYLSPENYMLHYQLATVLQQKGDIDGAVASYQKAIKIKPDSSLASFQLSKLLKSTNFDADIEVQSDGRDYYQQVKKLIEKKDFEAALTIYQKLLQDPSKPEKLHLDIAKILIQQNLGDRIIDCYNQTFHSDPNHVKKYHDLGLFFAENGFIEQAIACFRQAPKIQPKQEVVFEQIWQGLNHQAILEDDSYNTGEVSWQIAYEYFQANRKYTFFDLNNLAKEQRITLEEHGISIPNIELNKINSEHLEQIYINSFSDAHNIQVLKNEYKELKRERIKAFHGIMSHYYQQSIVRTGYIYAVCPLSGKIVRSNQSFNITPCSNQTKSRWFPVTFYRFVGREIFYIAVSRLESAKYLIYFPNKEIIITWSPDLHIDSSYVIDRLKSYAVSYWREFQSYISSNVTKKIALAFGFLPDFGHYTWNDLTGIHQLYEWGILDKIDKFLVGPSEYFKIDDIFPEIPEDKIIRMSDDWELFKTIVQNNYFSVRATDFFVKEALANRIKDGAKRRCIKNQFFVQNVEKSRQSFPLLWIVIRAESNYRVWASQIEGIANIINNLRLDFPNLGVVFDGWGRMEIKDDIAEIYINEEKAIVKKIQELLSNDIKTYDAVGCMNYEKVFWLDAADLFIATLSSTFVIVQHIGQKPGVYHSGSMIEKLYTHAYDIQCTFRENSNFEEWVMFTEKYVEEPGNQGYNNRYHCDWREIHEKIVKIINKIQQNGN